MNSTPSAWSTFALHAGRPYAFFLDRCDGSAPSFAGSAPTSLLWVDPDGVSHCWRQGRWHVDGGDPIRTIAAFVAEHEAAPEAVPSWLEGCVLPRTVGFLAYELGSRIEQVPVPRRDPFGLGLALLCTYERVDAWDETAARPVRIQFEAPIRGTRAVALAAPPGLPIAPVGRLPHPPPADRLRSAYRCGFARIKRAIAAGEVYQVNLSRRITTPLPCTPELVFTRMREEQPVPQGVFFDAGAFALLSNSPETFLRVLGRQVSTFPIKGTRTRSGDPFEDRRRIEELCNDEKERAEHLMIVDLERNDLGRICEPHSIAVPEFCRAHSFASVHHLVSEVRGRLRPRVGLEEILRATFPGGSITGAPKIKAMEIISEVESELRGPYTGSIGCFNGPRQVDLNIAIRTALSMNGKLYYSTGGGIVADSSLQGEYEETVTKAQVFLSAVRGPRAIHRSLAS